MSLQTRGRVTAVLGPTNTGKTHLAIERMLGHATGMIGFPLRLLARENYDRIVKLVGPAAVALLTGEERIMPAHPRWLVCTVESMPLDRRVDFLAVDEIQLCADPERGHVFTQRLLHARGDSETMFLGADTIRPLLRRLVPEAEFIARPRFSRLTYTGAKKPTRLPRRSAVVAFSAAEVYALAEMLRRQTGGAAVVLGALSPRTRNAQVGLFQAGEVDYLVATDAIGMGLNMDIDHVAFANLRKFDGRVARQLSASELAQIAGRAGRHMNDGTFGTTADIEGLDEPTISAIEQHSFPPLKQLQWRNDALRFTSAGALLAGLERPSELPGLIRSRDADDHLALKALSGDAETMTRAQGTDRVRLLWEVCQIPDFRKSLAEQHHRLLAVIFRHLSSPSGQLPADWLDAQLRRLERTDGEIDTLMSRIANVRTWTYISQRADWIADAASWRERTRALEDRLSDALHERLTQRFIDRRTAVLLRRLRDGDAIVPALGDEGEVTVEGHRIGHLDGFRFRTAPGEGANGTRVAATTALRALAPEIARRVASLSSDSDESFALSDDAAILWRDAPVARLVHGASILHPGIEILSSDMITHVARESLRKRIVVWLEHYLQSRLAPLFALDRAETTGAVRGLLFQLQEGLGSLPRQTAETQIAALNSTDRETLSRLGVRLGMLSLFLPAMLKPAALRLRGLLWMAAQGLSLPLIPGLGRRVMLPIDSQWPPGFAEAMGYRALGGRLVRIDMIERFAAEARKLAKDGPFAPPQTLPALLGATAADAKALLEALRYRPQTVPDGTILYAPPRGHRPRPRQAPRQEARADSPFAALRRPAVP